MTAKLPYILSVGLIPKIFEKMQNARRPERFTQDFLETKLGHSGGSARPIIPLLKRMGFLGSDGVPTPLYDQFRNADTQSAAIAQGMRNGFSELFDRNEYVYEMTRDKLTSLIVETTGGAKDDAKVKGIVGTFWALKEMADFEGEISSGKIELKPDASQPEPMLAPATNHGAPAIGASDNIDLRVGYTINLNLPETNDPEVFNAIFKALRENLLKNP